MADFLHGLRAHGSADLNGVLATLNDGSLVRETLNEWVGNRWIVIAPNAPLQALAGPDFSRELTLEQFCGVGRPPAERPAEGLEERNRGEKGSEDDEHP